MCFFMKILYLLIFSLVFFCLEIQAKPTGWKLARNANGVKVWQLSSNTDVIGSLQQKKRKKKIDWAKVNKQTFFKKIEKKKQEMLAFVEISGWKADKYQWTSQKGFHQLNIEGSYKDFQKRNFIF